MTRAPFDPPLRSHRPSLVAVATLAAVALTLAACGGSEPDAPAPADTPDAPTQPAPAPAAAAPNADADPRPTATPDPIPLVRFAAHGPAASTFGARCGDGIEGTSSDVFRVTAPGDWIYRGTGSGSGPDGIYFEVGGTRVEVDLYINREELDSESSFEDGGEAGVTVDLAGTPFPLHAVAVEDRTGYGILFVPWLVNLPGTADHEGSILISSREAGAVSAEVAAAVLGTVRAERCAAISRTLVWGPASGRMLVPEFEGGDPLGKTRPAEPARCVAPRVRERAASDPMLHLKVLVPSPSGTFKEELAALAAGCGG